MAYNYKMDKGKLLKVGFEAFGMLEEAEYGMKRRPMAPPKNYKAKAPAPAVEANTCLYQYRPQQALVYKVMNPVSYSTDEMVNSYEAMQLHDGNGVAVVMDYSKRKSEAAMAF